jgi:hypothetical protein
MGPREGGGIVAYPVALHVGTAQDVRTQVLPERTSRRAMRRT